MIVFAGPKGIVIGWTVSGAGIVWKAVCTLEMARKNEEIVLFTDHISRVVKANKVGGKMANILIVDDQPHLRELFSLELRDDRHRVCSVSNAESVNRYLMNSKPDLVLLDLYLNGFEGWDVLLRIKSQYPYLPVLIVTAYDNYAEDPRLSQADGYIVKDFCATERLKEKIADLLN